MFYTKYNPELFRILPKKTFFDRFWALSKLKYCWKPQKTDVFPTLAIGEPYEKIY